MIDHKALCERIKASGIKRVALAERLGISAPTLRAKLNGQSDITVGEAYIIAKTLGLTNREIKSIFFAAKCESNSPC